MRDSEERTVPTMPSMSGTGWLTAISSSSVVLFGLLWSKVGGGGDAFWGRSCCSSKGVDCARSAGVASEWSHAAVSLLTSAIIGLLWLYGWLFTSALTLSLWRVKRIYTHCSYTVLHNWRGENLDEVNSLGGVKGSNAAEKKNCDKIVLHTHLLVPFHSSSEECVVRSVLYKSNFVVTSVFICVMCEILTPVRSNDMFWCQKDVKNYNNPKNNNNNNKTKF